MACDKDRILRRTGGNCGRIRYQLNFIADTIKMPDDPPDFFRRSSCAISEAYMRTARTSLDLSGLSSGRIKLVASGASGRCANVVGVCHGFGKDDNYIRIEVSCTHVEWMGFIKTK